MAKTSTEGQEINAIIERARASDNKTLQEAFIQERNFRTRTKQELEALLAITKKLLEDQNFEKINKETLAKLQQDLDLINILNTGLQPFPVGTEATWSLKSNKMQLAITGAQSLMQKHFSDIAEGSLPEGYALSHLNADITMLGDNPSIYGNSKGTFLKTAALTLYLSCIQKNTLADVKLSSENTGSWIDHTAMAHVTPLPVGLNLKSLDERFERFTYSFSDELTPNGFAFVHSGYAFGGHRNEPRYPRGKPLGPEDCSSWVSKISGCPYPFTTYDQLLQYRLRFNERGEMVPNWSSSALAKSMDEICEPLVIRDPQTQIQAGQLYCHRTFAKTDRDLTSTGIGGHTGMVLGFNSQGRDSKVVILAYGREMPHIEGFGVQQFPYEPVPPSRKIMLFSLRGRAACDGTAVALCNTHSAGTTALISLQSPNRP